MPKHSSLNFHNNRKTEEAKPFGPFSPMKYLKNTSSPSLISKGELIDDGAIPNVHITRDIPRYKVDMCFIDVHGGQDHDTVDKLPRIQTCST